MAIEPWTVFYGTKDAGNQRPVNGWKEKELKVAKLGSGSTLEKNNPYSKSAGTGAAFGTLKTSEVQQCYFVTVEAESAEEACLVVDKFLSLGASPSAAQLESVGGSGPSVKTSVNQSGKAAACLASNITEVGVL